MVESKISETKKCLMTKKHIIPGIKLDVISEQVNFPQGKNQFSNRLKWLKRICYCCNFIFVLFMLVLFILFIVHFIAQPKTQAGKYMKFADFTDSISSPRYIPPPLGSVKPAYKGQHNLGGPT